MPPLVIPYKYVNFKKELENSKNNGTESYMKNDLVT